LLEIRSNGDLRFFAGNNNPVSISSGTGVIVANKDHFIEVPELAEQYECLLMATKRNRLYRNTCHHTGRRRAKNRSIQGWDIRNAWVHNVDENIKRHWRKYYKLRPTVLCLVPI